MLRKRAAEDQSKLLCQSPPRLCRSSTTTTPLRTRKAPRAKSITSPYRPPFRVSRERGWSRSKDPAKFAYNSEFFAAKYQLQTSNRLIDDENQDRILVF